MSARFLRRIQVVFATTIVVTLLMAACAPSAPSSPAPAAPAGNAPASAPSQPAATATPPPLPTPRVSVPVVAAPTPTPGTQAQRGGILTIANPDSPAHFDLQQGVRIDTSIPFRNVYSALLRRDPQETEKIIPELAESWSVSPDGLKYTFVLRKGVKWHDGQPLTTQDVAFSLMRMAHPPKGTTSPRGQSLLEGVVAAKALDDSRVEVTLAGTSSSFLSRVATDWVVIMPKHTIEKYGDMKQVVNGSGPFKFVRYTPSVSVEMTRNEEYYAQGRPFVNGVAVYILPDVGTSFAALRTGRVLLSTVGSRAATDAQVRIAQSDLSDKLTVERYQSFTRYILIPNEEVKPWGDIRVRQAVDLAIDRQAFEKLTLLGKMGGYFHPETKWGFSRQELLTQPGFRQPKDQDIADAKKLLAEAGFASGVDAPLMCRRGEDCEIFSSALKGQLEKVGVRLTLNPTESVTMDQKFAKGEFSVSIYPLGVLQDDPDQIIFEQYVTTGTRNHARFSDPQIDALATEQARTLDESKRRALVRKIDERLMNAHVYPPVLWLDYVRVYSKSVRGIRNGPGLWTDQNMEYVWLAK